MLREAFLIFSLLIVVTQGGWNRSGQLSGTLRASREYPANTEITDFGPEGHQLKNIIHENGRLKVTRKGHYYIYAQVFFESLPSSPFHNRAALAVNGNVVNLLQTGLGAKGTDYGSRSTSAIVYLEKDDYISLQAVSVCKMWMAPAHTLFGTFRIGR